VARWSPPRTASTSKPRSSGAPPPPRQHGHFRPRRASGRPPGAAFRCAIRRVHPTRWAFLDTETTGLAGGTGTYAFLIGVGSIEPAGFRLRQFFMRDYGEEASQLYRLAEYLAQFDVLVTYNGKAYDSRCSKRASAWRARAILRPHGAPRPALRRASLMEAAPRKLPPSGPGEPDPGVEREAICPAR